MSPILGRTRALRRYLRWTLLVLLALAVALPHQSALAVDTTKPYVKGYDPADGEGNVEIDTVVTIEFSEDIRAENLGNHIILKDGRGFKVDNRLSYSNITFRAILTPLEPLKYSMTYFVNIDAFIVDQSGNPLEQPVAWSFNTTKEKVPPEVVSTNPTNGATGVAIDADISVRFSEEMDKESLRTGLVVHDSQANPVIGNTTPSKDGMSVTFDPLFAYAFGETYTVTVLKTARDLAGNNLRSDHVFSFRVQLEQIKPRVVSLEPYDGKSGVKRTVRIIVTFSEPMNSTSLAGTVAIQDPDFFDVPLTPTYNADNYTLTIRPDQALDYNTIYTVIVEQEAKDMAGNFLDKQYTSTWTTEPIPQQPPELVGKVPDDDDFNWYEGHDITFSIEAEDPNGDILVYTWWVNGELQDGETHASYRFYPETGSAGSYKVDVEVNDGITSPVRHYWIVSVLPERGENGGGGDDGEIQAKWVVIFFVLGGLLAVVLYGYLHLMERKKEILTRTRRRLRPLSFKKTAVPDKPPSYEELYLRPDGVYSKKSPAYTPIAPPGGYGVKTQAAKEASVEGEVMGEAPQLIAAKEVEVRRATRGPYTTAAPELKKTRVPGALVCPKCGQKAIEAAHGRVWCDTCGFIE